MSGVHVSSQQTRNFELMLGYCWVNVEDGWPALTQPSVNGVCRSVALAQILLQFKFEESLNYLRYFKSLYNIPLHGTKVTW